MTDARLERLRVVVEELTEERDRLLDEAKSLMRERDERFEQLKSARLALEDMTEHAEEFKQEISRFKAERDEAREWAEAWRDGAYQALNAEVRNGFKFPWERG